MARPIRQDRYTTEVIINPIGGTLQMLGTCEKNDGLQPQPQSLSKTPEPPMDFDDDIPF